MENIFSKIKEGNNKKQIENIVIIIVLLIIVIIVINSLFNSEEIDNEVSRGDVTKVISNDVHSDELENKLKNILSHISGVGSAEVMVSYSNTILQVPMFDTKENTTTVEEEDVNGGKRKTEEISNEQNIIYEEKNNTKVPAIKQTIMPEVIGVIVVAEGASNSVVQENIKNAVGAVVNIASHRIQVFSK